MTKKKRQPEHADDATERGQAGGSDESRQDQTVDEAVLSGLEDARKEAAENYDKYIRLAADFDNYKKRTQKDRSDLINYGNEALIRDVLPILDSLERALDHASNAGDFESFVKGLHMILEQFQNTLGKHGVESLEALGNEFDPNYHEAMMRVDSNEVQDNTVVEEFEKGYLLKGRLLRPAKVAVAKTPQ